MNHPSFHFFYKICQKKHYFHYFHNGLHQTFSGTTKKCKNNGREGLNNKTMWITGSDLQKIGVSIFILPSILNTS